MAIRLFEDTTQARRYSQFRPAYPQQLLDIITGFIVKNGGGFGLAVDVACGTGHSTFPLRSHFTHCLGTDISEAQVQYARQKGKELDALNVEFKVASATNLPVEDASVDFVSCAEAWHWLEPEALYREVNRVLKPGGCLAVYGYRDPTLLNEECNDLLTELISRTLKDYSHERLKHLDNFYSEVTLPYPNSIRFDLPTEMSYSMEISNFIGYVSSWSSYQTYCERHPRNSVLEELQRNMESVLKATVSQSDSGSKAGEQSDSGSKAGGQSDSGSKTGGQSDSNSSTLKVDMVFPVFGHLGQK